jgi:adenine-specific DNA-methyltransferase
MTDHRTKLKTLLRELFQFDAADLDFGIYRIMNQRRDEIDAFIEHGLLDTVAQEFTLLQQDVIREKQEELAGLAHQVRNSLGDAALDAQGNIIQAYTQLPLSLRYIQKQKEITQATVSAEAEAEIFNALYTFFSRYYDRGDFITKRRYSRAQKYAIPYNGEEVLLHWANRDQYYVKTSDTLTDYAFRIASHGGYRVRFKLAAADTEQGNVKGDKRYFFPLAENVAQFTSSPLAGGTEGGIGGGQLTLFFEYRPLTGDESAEYGRVRVQQKIIEAERERVLNAVPDRTLRGLLATWPAGHEIPLLDLHLTRWTRKATSDYFIHKDLQGFLERELDFYLKNEIMRLDDLDTANAARAEQYLTRLVVIRRIAHAVIAFLAQIEDFEKALFEKPKFVLASQWCVTLDRVPQDLWPQVAANDAQWAAWEQMFGVVKTSEVSEDLEGLVAAHPTLTVDTALYDVAFKDALLAALSERDGGLEAQRDGLLVHGENFQALTLLQAAYWGKVKCIYIDPPYNTGNDEFIYKDNFQHSTWLTMMTDRLLAGRDLLAEDGIIFISIDDNEYPHLRQLLDFTFGENNFVANVIWQKVFSPKNTAKYFSEDHDYLLVFARDKLNWQPYLLPRNAEADARYNNPDDDPRGPWASSDLTARNYYSAGQYKITSPAGRVFTAPPGRYWTISKEKFLELDREGRVWWGESGENMPRLKRFLSDVKRGIVPQTLWKHEQVGNTQEAKKELLSTIIFEHTEDVLNTVKPTRLIRRVLQVSTTPDVSVWVVDFFAGSGTTAHAIINLNREDSSKRKYILVEQGDYFDTVLKPRIQKVMYAADWKDGQPVKGSAGSSHAFQYLRLESYEDTLDNLDLHDADVIPGGLFLPQRDDYLLRYFLDHETRRSRLNVDEFATPFDYQLRVRRDGVETRVGVDLVETANLLLGLSVQAQRTYQHQERVYRVVFGKAGREQFVGEQSVLVIWRDTAGLDIQAEATFVRAEIMAGREFDQVYVNGGDSHIPGALPIEAVFMDAMHCAPRASVAALTEEN